MKTIAQQLVELQEQHAYRQRRVLQGPQGTEIYVDGNQYLSFCSNDYLGLANDERVCQAAKDAINKFGVGSGASQLISGYSSAHIDLEKQLAKFFGFEQVVLFSSGYLANLGVLATFTKKDTLILEDRLNHASLIDAAKHSNAKLKRYKHCDFHHAEQIINNENANQILIATDGVFSMEGTIAPIEELYKLKRKYGGYLVIDDAHGIGVLGDNGKGSLEAENIDVTKVDLLIGTFGKSFGTSGAYVCGSKDYIEFLIQKARTLIYTTAPAPALAAATSKSLDIIIKEPERRTRLHGNIQYFRESLAKTPLQLEDSITAIQTIELGDNEKAIKFSQALEEYKLLVIAIRPPTVPPKSARLRITLCSEHTYAQIDKLVSALAEINQRLN
ncbi:MAG: 8-amino-7-oxononanoate synthase [Pseudomonadota bacterium]